MSDVLIALVTKQGEKLDEHLANLRKTIHETNNNLQGVIGTVQLTRQDMTHNNDLSDAKLEALKVTMTRLEGEMAAVGGDLKKDLALMDGEVKALQELSGKVNNMHFAYTIAQRGVITALVGGVLYATVLVTKIKTGGL